MSNFNEITELTRRDFLVSTARGVGGLAFAKLLEADGLLAADASKRPTAAPANPLAVQGLSLVKPPYGLLSAISLDRGEMVWQVPHGETPDAVRNHPALKGMNIPRTGQNGPVGLVVTKSLVIMGDPQVTTTPEHPRGAMLRAYDKARANRWAPC